ERLRHGDGADHVHLELAAELVEVDELERRADADPGVVHEPAQALAAERRLHLPRRALDGPAIGHVDAQRRQPARALLPQGLGILVAPDSCEDVKPSLGEVTSGGAADASGCAGDDDRALSAHGARLRVRTLARAPSRGSTRRSPGWWPLE